MLVELLSVLTLGIQIIAVDSDSIPVSAQHYQDNDTTRPSPESLFSKQSQDKDGTLLQVQKTDEPSSRKPGSQSPPKDTPPTNRPELNNSVPRSQPRNSEEIARLFGERQNVPPPTRRQLDPDLVAVGKHPPAMLGQFLGVYAPETLVVSSYLSDLSVPNFALVNDYYRVLTPVSSRGSFMVAENESPWPEDRVFLTHNAYYQIDVRTVSRYSTLTLLPAANAYEIFGPGPFTLRKTFFDTLLNNPDSPPSSLTTISATPMQRDTLGFEKTLFDGAASVEMRLPIMYSRTSLSGSPSDDYLANFGNGPTTASSYTLQKEGSNQQVGDVTVLFKYALYRNEEAGCVVSTGAALTIPTSAISTFEGSGIRSFIFQPFIGYVYSAGQLYLQGFASIAVPTDDRDVTLLFNNIGLGWYLYTSDADKWLRGITPTAELHLTTPLGGNDQGLYAPDMLVGTLGMHFDIGSQSRLTLGVATPLTGNSPFGIEAIVQYNIYW